MVLTDDARERVRAGARISAQVQKERKHQRSLQYNKHPKSCAFCSSPLTYEKRRNKYCSHSCAAKNTNLGTRKNFNPENFITCSSCGTEVHLKYKSSRKQCFVCSPKAGKALSSEACSTPVTLRRYLIRTRTHECSICFYSLWQGRKIPLEVDHKDGNSENNSEGNLRLICPNCHAQTPTYKGKNKGRGRAKRAQRYRDGKSY